MVHREARAGWQGVPYPRDDDTGEGREQDISKTWLVISVRVEWHGLCLGV